MSPLDWRCHAINEHCDHPNGVLIAECGHRLMIVTNLYDHSYGEPCKTCTAQQPLAQ
ncbi:MAG TPA: hypothetical protein VGP04_21850 [Pseudonocardiaceae bacterium]|nr:hypothetical protein [Pseudonocardiaceae bacterium]